MEGIIKNPTNELMEPMHGGRTFPFPPGHVMQVSDATAKHILNEYTARGLVSLNYGDDTRKSKTDTNVTIEHEKCQAGIKANIKFKTMQVERYNQDNESRANNKTPYVKPPEQIALYAKELGLELIAPYRVVDKSQVEKNELEQQNKELLDMVNRLGKQVESLLNNKDGGAELPTNKELEEEAIISKFMRLNTKSLKNFVEQDRPTIAAWPEHLKTKLRERYTYLTGNALTI